MFLNDWGFLKMDLDDLVQKRKRLEQDANDRIQDALNSMRSDLEKSNSEVDRQLKNLKDESNQEKEKNTDTYETESQKQIPHVSLPKQNQPVKKPLIFFSYPMTGYDDAPAWTETLRQVLVSNGYLVYNPWQKVDEIFSQEDLPTLNALPIKIVKSLCSILAIPEETLLPFESVWKFFQKAATRNDNYSVVFQTLWFLIRSSLVVCDLMRPVAGHGTPCELLWSKQIGIPVIGLLPTSGYLSPFAHRSVTCLYTGNDLLQLLPLIKGYSPNSGIDFA